jgi:SAM-dependent methyltransferase
VSTLNYNKVCNFEDFDDPSLRRFIRDVRPVDHERADDTDYPRGQEHRKAWEIGMTARALADHGVLEDDAEVLGVGAGTEMTIFWLTRHVGRVFATDLYLDEDEWSGGDSTSSMLGDPGSLWPSPWNPRRLVVQHMNALELRYEDCSFDGIFSSSALEHFGTDDDIRLAVEEMFRVLKPGGLLALSTEFRISGPPAPPEWTTLFDRSELERTLLDGLAWSPVSPLDTSISERTLATEQDFRRVLEMQATGNAQPEPCPHLVLRQDDAVWTSVHLTLRKAG